MEQVLELQDELRNTVQNLTTQINALKVTLRDIVKDSVHIKTNNLYKVGGKPLVQKEMQIAFLATGLNDEPCVDFDTFCCEDECWDDKCCNSIRSATTSKLLLLKHVPFNIISERRIEK